MLDLAHALHENIQIVIGLAELALDLLLAVFKDDDARGFLENGAPVLGLGVHDLLDLALPDDGIPLFAHAHAVQKVDDVLHAAGLFVDEIFAFAAAIKAARHRHFREIQIEHTAGVVECERDFAERLRFARLRAAENDVLHVGTAQGLCRLFAEHPADGIRHVALAAAVRPDDTGHAVIEFYFGFVRKGLETVEFDFLEIQCAFFSPWRSSLESASFAAACSASRWRLPLPSPVTFAAYTRTVKTGACSSPDFAMSS